MTKLSTIAGYLELAGLVCGLLAAVARLFHSADLALDLLIAGAVFWICHLALNHFVQKRKSEEPDDKGG